MAKTHRKRSSSSHRRRHRRHFRGGDLAGNPPSASGWAMGTLGNGWTQFMNSLSLQPGQNLGAAQSNAIVPVNNLNAQTSQPGVGPTLQGAVPQAGGRRHRRRRRGGSFGAVLTQAAAPLVLIGAQQMVGTRRRSRRHRGGSRHRRSRTHRRR